MKLNNKGFAISSIMYLILMMAIILISATLAILSGRKLILDKLKNEVSNDIYNVYNLSYRQVLEQLKIDATEYATSNSITKDSIKISDLNDIYNNIDDKVLDGYKLSDRYLTMNSSESSYDIYLGKAVTLTGNKVNLSNMIDVVDYKVYGNSEQKNKNLFNPTQWKAKSTTNGVTVEYLESEDCFLLNGTMTTTGSITLRFINVPVESSNYSLSSRYISGTITKKEGDYSVGYFGKNDELGVRKNWETIDLKQEDSVSEALSPGEKYITSFWFYISEGVVFDNYKVRIQLEEGPIATEYEPSNPSPETPIEVKSLGENSKNLVDINAMSVITYNDSIQRAGWVYENTGGKTFTISYGETATLPTGVLLCNFLDENNKTVLSSAIQLYTNSTTVTVPDGARLFLVVGQINVQSAQNLLANNNVSYIQIEEGSTATPYRPYKYIDIVSSGKNLFDKSSVINGKAYNSLGNLVSDANYFLTDYINIEGLSNITISGSSSSTTRYSKFFDINKQVVGQLFNATDKSVTVPTGAVYAVISGQLTQKDTLQIEQGSTETTYEPYIEPVTTRIDLTGHEPLRKVDDKADYMDYGNQRIVRNTGKYIFNGTENWTLAVSGENTSRYYSKPNIPYAVGNANTRGAMTNYFPQLQKTQNNNTDATYCSLSGGTDYSNLLNVRVNNSKIADAAALKSWVLGLYDNGKPLTFYYQLFEGNVPSNTTLPKLNINNGSSTINIDSGIMPSNAEFTVIQKIKQL